MIAEGEMELGPGLLRAVLCRVLRKMPDSDNWSEYPNIWGECQYLFDQAPWYRVYDFVEALYQDIERDKEWAERINGYFLEAGVGWRFVDGKLESPRGGRFRNIGGRGTRCPGVSWTSDRKEGNSRGPCMTYRGGRSQI